MRAGVAVRIVLMGVVIGAAPAVSSAQDGLRSASLPERPLTASVPPPPSRADGYRAGPGTFRPGPHRRSQLPVFGYYGPQLAYPYEAYPYDQPYPQPIIVVPLPSETRPAQVAPPAAAPAPYVAGAPGRPKTFYVIPGCYAGDRRPEPGSLAAECSLTRLRIVQPS